MNSNLSTKSKITIVCSTQDPTLLAKVRDAVASIQYATDGIAVVEYVEDGIPEMACYADDSDNGSLDPESFCNSFGNEGA